ncbi:MAG: hypothetical protein ACTHU0_33800 [Kofleriaceae bacterium]
MRYRQACPALCALLSLSAAAACGDGKSPSSPDGAPADGLVPDAPPTPGDPATGAWRRFAMPGIAGANSGVADIAIAADGSTVYLGGHFSDAAGLAARNVVAWNGTDYVALGDGIEGRVPALAIDGDGALWAVGSVDAAGVVTSRLYRWTGSAWQVMPGLIDHEVLDLQFVGGDAIVVGTFGHAGDAAARGVARFDGAAWHAVGAGLTAGFAATVAPTPDGFCVGGQFTMIGGVAADHAACWNGTAWRRLGTGLLPRVSVLARSPDGTWYAGGRFSLPGLPGDPGYAIASLRPNGAWETLDSGVGGGAPNDVRAIAFLGADVVIAGSFGYVGRGIVQTSHLARWSPTAGWSAYGGGGVRGDGSGLDHGRIGANALAVAPDGAVWVGGSFLHAGDAPAVNVARIANGDARAVVGPRPVSGIGGYVTALALRPDGALLAGGRLAFGGQVPLDELAIHDGTTWAKWGDLRGEIYDIVVRRDGSIAVAGMLTLGGEASAVAIWRNQAWTLVGGPVEGAGAVVFEDGQDRLWLVRQVLGGPTQALVLEGDTWTEQARFERVGVPGSVAALAEWNGRVVVGGQFDAVNGEPIEGLAIQDGAGGWDALGGGLTSSTPGYVSALASSPSLGLIVGGSFDRIGNAPHDNLAAWDGTSWHDLAGGVRGTTWPVSALWAHRGGVFVAGDFDRAGGAAAARIAWFDGAAWHAMDGGLDERPRSMAVHDNVLYVGGPFSEAGGQASGRIAAWDFAR